MVVCFLRTHAAMVAIVIALIACSDDLLPPGELLARADKALADGEAEAAIVDVKTALQQEPDNAEARLLLGEIHLLRQQPGEAIETLERAWAARKSSAIAEQLAQALARGGEHKALIDRHNEREFELAESRPGYLAALARALVLDGAADEAADAIDEAWSEHPGNPDLALAQALIWARGDGDIERGAALLESTLETDPDADPLWSALGDFRYALGDTDGTADAYARAVAVNPYRVKDRLNLLTVLLLKGDREPAREQLELLEQLIPTHPQVNFARAALLLEDGSSDKALEKLTPVLSAAPNHVPSLYLAANANAQEGNLEQALNQFEQVLKLRPRHLEARTGLGSVSLRLGEPERAEALARDALEDFPMNLAATRLLAAALAAQGLFLESSEAYAKALEVAPEAAETRAAYGVALARGGDLEAGIAELEEAVDNAPDSARLRAILVRAYIAGGRTEDARRVATAFREANPDLADAHLLEGALAQALGEPERAREAFDKALEIQPGDARARRSLAGLSLAGGDSDAALELFAEALESDPDDLASQMSMASLYESRGELDAMEATLREASQRHPLALEPRLALGRYYFAKGRPGEAVSLLTAVRDRYGDNPVLHQLLAGSFLAMNEFESALASARRFAELRPEDPVAVATWGEAAWKAGELAAAEEHLRDALALEERVDIRERLVDVLLLREKLDEAEAELDKLPKEGAVAERAQFTRGRMALAEGDLPSARRYFEAAWEIEPNSRNVLYLAGLRWQQRERSAALDLLRDWLADNPSDTAVLNQLGSYYAFTGNDAAAAEAFEKLTKLAPDDPVVLNNLAWSYRAIDPEKAVAYAARAMELSPGTPSIQDTFAMVLLESGDPERALSLSDAVLAAEPENMQFLLHRARILIALDRRPEARDILEGLPAGEAAPEGAAELRQRLGSTR